MNKLNVGFSYILILMMLGFLTGCSSMFQGRTVVTFTDGTNTNTAIVEGTKANVEIDMKEKKAKIDQTGKSLSDKLKGILPPVNIDK